MDRVMHVDIGSALYNKMIQCIESNGNWRLDGAVYKITGAKRGDNTSQMRIELTQITH